MDLLRLAIREELAAPIAELRAFVDRRVAELSAELHASLELGEMGEARMCGQLSAIQDGIAQLIALPAAATRNSGLELEAVVQATEAAADTILEAAEAIQDWAAVAAKEPADLRALAERVNAIFEACSFQDLTGQRVRRAIQHLQQVEAMLAGMLPGGGTAVTRVEVPTAARTVADATADLGQGEIDALLKG
jgi:chemotaxis regulatin CheY-phosphate phosphatase CheZ